MSVQYPRERFSKNQLKRAINDSFAKRFVAKWMFADFENGAELIGCDWYTGPGISICGVLFWGVQWPADRDLSPFRLRQ